MRGWLETNYPYYAEECLRIVDKRGRVVPLKPKPGQLRVEAAIREQEEAGLPVRLIVPKARKEGVSTWIEGRMMWRTTTRPNWRALVVAHNAETTGELHQMSTGMVARLPHETIAGLELHPPIASAQKKSEITFGTKERTKRLDGDEGLNSSFTVATAGEVDTSRGLTIFDLHLSEVAFYEQGRQALKALLNTVPDEPTTMIVLESTPNGRNEFYRRCMRAQAGKGSYKLVFLAWWEEPDYVRPFIDPLERDRFIDSIGTGEFGDDEGDLVQMMLDHGFDWDVIPEKLHWREWAIEDKAGGILEDFHQEYPSTIEEAFAASAGQVFSAPHITKARAGTERPSLLGVLSSDKTVEKQKVKRGRPVLIPQRALWTPKGEIAGAIHTSYWEVWETPQMPVEPTDEKPEGKPGGQYVVTVDPASGEELAGEQGAYSAIEVINHRTLEQVAEYRSREDAGPIGLQALLAAIHYRNAILAVEITGGYGNSIVSWLYRDIGYPRLYYRSDPQAKRLKKSQRMGWQTTPITKPMIENRAKELLRTQTSGIRSAGLLDEMASYVRDDKGRTGPEENAFADRYMAWGIGHVIAMLEPVRPDRLSTVQISTRAA